MDNISIHAPLADRLWFFEIIIGILVLVAINFLVKHFIRYLRQRSMLISMEWKERVEDIFLAPIQILLWILGVTLVIEILGRRFDFSFFETYLNAFRSTGFVFCTAWMLLRWKKETQRIFLQKDRHQRNIETGFVQMIGKLVTVTVVLIGLMIVLQIWGLDILPLVAFGGIGAAAIGFAAKDVISNFFGGFMLHLNRPFVVGDHVLLPGKNLEGVVEEIGWNLTMIRDREKRPTYVPSALFSQELVINFSRMSHRRLIERISIDDSAYGKLPELTEAIKKAIGTHPDIDRHLPIIVALESFREKALTLLIDIYTLQTRYEKYMQVKHEVLSRIYNELKKSETPVSIPSLAIYTSTNGVVI